MVDSDPMAADLEAFRGMSEVIVALRQRLRADLEARHGEDWLARGVPEAVRERLAGKKDREDTVAWYSSGDRELWEYVDFFDMAEIIDAQGPGIELLAGIFPQAQILRARLSELQVLAQKLAHAHHVVEEELALLANMRSRLNLAPAQPRRPVAPAPAPGEQAAPPSAMPSRPPDSPQPPPSPAVPPQAPAPPEPPAPAPVTATPVAPNPATHPAPLPTPRTFPKSDGPRSAPPTPSFDEVMQALDRRQHSIVLRALYAEIMAAAESVWARGIASSLKIWYAVRESPWYQEQFVPLGLKPVSDFYSVIEDLQTTLGSSAPKERVHEFLNSRAFAQVLLSLRELFQRNLKT